MKRLSSEIFGRDVKKIAFFGIGRSNVGIMKMLSEERVEIILRSDGVIDREKIPDGLKISAILEGADACCSLNEDALVLSPSVRREREPLSAAAARGMLLTSDAELFFDNIKRRTRLCPTCEPLLFGVTGSDGKSTTTTLACELLRDSFPDARAIGNIGEPMLPSLPRLRAGVVELSSFQLSYLSPPLRRAAITNVTPNHLDWHSSFSEYKRAKKKILEAAKEYVISADCPVCLEILCSELGRGKAPYAIFSLHLSEGELRKRYPASVYITAEGGALLRNGQPLIPISSLGRREDYNIQNIMCAVALTDGFASEEHIKDVGASFRGLMHRAEMVATVGGVDYINSSIDTTPTRTARTLTSLGRRVILILGGKGKGLSSLTMAEAVKKYARAAVVFGSDGRKIKEELCDSLPILEAGSLEEAVAKATEIAEAGEAVLLSPSMTSYDAYSSFEERGEHFKKIVSDIKNTGICK